MPITAPKLESSCGMNVKTGSLPSLVYHSPVLVQVKICQLRRVACVIGRGGHTYAWWKVPYMVGSCCMKPTSFLLGAAKLRVPT